MEKSEIFGYFIPTAVRQPKSGIIDAGLPTQRPYKCITVAYKPDGELYQGANPAFIGKILPSTGIATTYTYFQGDASDGDSFDRFNALWEQYKEKATDYVDSFGHVGKHITDQSVLGTVLPILAYRHSQDIMPDADGNPYVFQMLVDGKPRLYGEKHVDKGLPIPVTTFTTLVLKGGKSAKQLETAWIDRNLGAKARIELVNLRKYKSSKVGTLLRELGTSKVENLEPHVDESADATE